MIPQHDRERGRQRDPLPQIFVAHAEADEACWRPLLTHLTPAGSRRADVRHSGALPPGASIDEELRSRLEQARVIVFLISADFLAEERYLPLVRRAFQLQNIGRAAVVPVLVRAAHIDPSSPLAGIQLLPEGETPVMAIPEPDRETVWRDVARTILSRVPAGRRDPSSRGLRGGDEGLDFPGGGAVHRDFFSRVRRVAELLHPNGAVTELPAPEPFEGALVVRRRHMGEDLCEPIGALNMAVTTDEMVEGVLSVFRAEINAPYRAEDPLLQSWIVHPGEPAPRPLRDKARRWGVRLVPFREYQHSLASFDRYLAWQARVLGADSRYPAEIYVEQRAEVRIHLYREKLESALAEMRVLLTDPEPRFLLVLGDPGAGKTFLLRRLARLLGDAHLQDSASAPAPVLVEMRNLEKSRDLDKLLAQHFQSPESGAIRVDAFRYLLSEGKAVLLFDGFDELAFRVTYDRVIEHFQTVLQAAQGKAKVVVTSRTAHFLNDRQIEMELSRKASHVEGYRMIKILPFEDDQILAALEKRLGGEAEAEHRIALLRAVEDLIGLSRNPRMLDFIQELPDSELVTAGAHDVSAGGERDPGAKITASALYERIVTRWLEGEVERARQSRAELALSLPELWKAVTDFARLLWSRTEKGILPADVPAGLLESLVVLQPHGATSRVDPEEIKVAVGSRSLLVRDEAGRLSFLHESIADWLVARSAAAEVAECGEAACLGERGMNALMVDFWITMTGRQAAMAWARKAVSSGETEAIQNANRVLLRLRAPAPAAEETPGSGTAEPVAFVEDVSDFAQIDLSGANLRGQDFSGTTHLRGAILRGADLVGASLVGADLEGADLEGAQLGYVNAEGASLRNAKLARSDLWGARLRRADLRGADLRESRLRYADLLGAQAGSEALALADTWGACPPRPSRAEPATARNLVQGEFSMGLAIHPDGRLLACGNAGGELLLWDLATGKCLRTWGAHGGSVTSLAFSPDGRTLASGSDDRTLGLWDVASGERLRSLQGHSGSVRSVAYSPDGRTLTSGSDDHTLGLWDVASGERLRSLQGHSGSVRSVAYSPDGRTLASGSRDHTLGLWNVASGKRLRSLQGHSGSVRSVAYSPDGRTLASGSSDHTLRLWDVASGERLRSLQGHSGGVRSVAYSPDGRTLTSGSDDHTLGLWDVASGKRLRSLQGHSGPVQSVAYSPDGRTLTSGSFDNTLRLWDVASGEHLRSLQGHSGSVLSVAYSPDGRTLTSGSFDNTLRLWDVASGERLRSLQGHSSGVLSVAYSPDGRTLASGSHDRTLGLWDVASGERLRSLQGHSGWVWSVAYSPDGRTLASGSSDRTLGLWDVASGERLRSLQGHSGSVLSVAYSPDGRTLASGSSDRTLGLWDVASGERLRSLQGHSSGGLSVAYSPDGRTLSSGSDDHTVGLWDVASGERLRSLQGHSDSVLSVAYSPDGRTLTSGSDDRTLGLWDVASGERLRSLRGHSGPVLSVAYSPDGRTLVSGSFDNTLRLWRVADGACLAVLVPAPHGWAAYTPDGRYKLEGDVTNHFWHVVQLVRFEAGELEGHEDAFHEQKPIRLPRDAPLIGPP